MSVRSLTFGFSLYRRCRTAPQVRFLSATGAEKLTGKYPTIRQLAEELAEVMGVEVGYKAVPKSREHLQALIPQSVKELPPRTMKDSFTVGVIPLGSDAVLQEKYVSLTGQVRISRFLEDMDLFAVVVAQKFILNPKVKPGMHSPYTIVTALVDRIEFTGYTPKLTTDVRISGHVSWVGNTSVEVVVWLDQFGSREYHRITQSSFLLACRDAMNAKSALINPLVAENEVEEKLIASGNKRKLYRQELGKTDLSVTIPTVEEQKIIHDLYRRTHKQADISWNKTYLPSGCIWMENCTLSNIIHAFPQHRNIQNTVFGGFLMRSATQLTFTLALLFSKFRPVLKCINDIQFRHPVYMSDLLKMHACIVYTENQYMQILAIAETWQIQKNITMQTNSFHFTYEVPEDVQEVIPQTYREAMRHIDGRRHFISHSHRLDYWVTPITTFGEPKYTSLKYNK